MRYLVAALLLFVVAAVAAAGEPAVTYGRGTVTIVQNGQRHRLAVEVADTWPSRARGLMHRQRLDEDAGMLFVFDTEDRWGFWMKNTLIPLSIAWIDHSWKIVDIQDMEVVPPGATETPIYMPAKAGKYALEVNKGYFRARGITPGAKLVYRPAR